MGCFRAWRVVTGAVCVMIGGGGIAVTVNQTSWTSLSGPIAATAVGGQPPVLWSWVFVSGDPDVEPTSQFSNSTNFTVPSPVPGNTYNAVYRPRAQDSTGAVGLGPDVSVTVNT